MASARGAWSCPGHFWLQRQLSALGDSYNDQDILQTSLQSQAATAVTIQCYRGVHGLLQSFQALRLSSLGARNRMQRFWRACRTQVQEAYLHCWGCERYQDWDVLICDWSTTPSRRPELRTHLGPAEQHHLIACKASPEVEESKAAASCKGGSCLGAMRDGLVHASRGSG